MYKIRYLPLALYDLKEIVSYIANKLEAPRAAERLAMKINREIKKIAENPFRRPLYVSPEKLKYEYRVLRISNYSLFYVIENNNIEVHRIIYSHRDIPQILTGEA